MLGFLKLVYEKFLCIKPVKLTFEGSARKYSNVQSFGISRCFCNNSRVYFRRRGGGGGICPLLETACPLWDFMPVQEYTLIISNVVEFTVYYIVRLKALKFSLFNH